MGLTSLQVITAVIAVMAIASPAFFAYLNWRRERVAFRQNYFKEIRVWADEVSDLMSEAMHLCDLDPKKMTAETFFDRRHRLRIALSSMIDRGRWFFPNLELDDHGKNKPPGFRGYRHEILDGIVRAYRSVDAMNCDEQTKNGPVREDLFGARRHFVGCAQRIFDPAKQRSEFEKIVGKIHKE